MNVQPEHIQGTAAIPMRMALSKALQFLKGISSRLFFEKHPKARLMYQKGNLWSRGSFASSVGFVQAEIVQTYVRTQEEHHQESYTFRCRRMSSFRDVDLNILRTIYKKLFK